MANFYFNNFPYVNYRFGDEVTPVVFQKLSVYSDIIDQVKNSKTFYSQYHIPQGERPDTLSYKLYSSVDYYWTFFMLNDKLRFSGWPLSPGELFKLADNHYYPNQSVTTIDPIHDVFPIGSIVTGNQSAIEAEVIQRKLDLGQLTLRLVSGSPQQVGASFLPGEQLQTIDDQGMFKTITVFSAAPQSFATHHYEDSLGHPADINPFDQNASGLTEITNREDLNNRNNELRQISVLKSNIISEVVGELQSSVKRQI